MPLKPRATNFIVQLHAVRRRFPDCAPPLEVTEWLLADAQSMATEISRLRDFLITDQKLGSRVIAINGEQDTLRVWTDLLWLEGVRLCMNVGHYRAKFHNKKLSRQRITAWVGIVAPALVWGEAIEAEIARYHAHKRGVMPFLPISK